jgi:hypothetical protein
MCPVVEVQSAQHLFLSCSTFGSFGRQSDPGLTSRRLPRTISQTTFFNLLIQQAVFDVDGLFCNSSDSHVFGLHETKKSVTI